MYYSHIQPFRRNQQHQASKREGKKHLCSWEQRIWGWRQKLGSIEWVRNRLPTCKDPSPLKN